LSVEDRLDRIEKILAMVTKKIEEIEDYLKKIGLLSDEVYIASELATAFSIPIYMSLEATKRIISLFTVENYDPITKAIIKSLALCDKLNVSELTRRVKALRGKASRRIVREKLNKLVEKGVVVPIDSGGRRYYVLYKCLSS